MIQTIRGLATVILREPKDLVQYYDFFLYSQYFLSVLKCFVSLPEAQIEQLKTVAVTIDCGGYDIAFDNAVKTFQQMKKVGLNVQWRSEYGIHATFYWYDGLCKALRFFTRNFADRCE